MVADLTQSLQWSCCLHPQRPHPVEDGRALMLDPLLWIEKKTGKTLEQQGNGDLPMLTERAMHRVDDYEMVRRRTAPAGLKGSSTAMCSA